MRYRIAPRAFEGECRRVPASGSAFLAYKLDKKTEEMKIPSCPPLSQRASTNLDLIRGLAALAVAANHLRNVFFVNFPQLEHKSAPIAVLYAFSALGHQCVMVFFVLSGYFVSASVLKFRTLEAWSVQAYAINRLARLYVVLIPALAVTAACDFAARQLPFGDLYFNHRVPNFVVVVFGSEDHLKQFFCQPIFSTNHSEPTIWFQWRTLEPRERILVLHDLAAVICRNSLKVAHPASQCSMCDIDSAHGSTGANVQGLRYLATRRCRRSYCCVQFRNTCMDARTRGFHCSSCCFHRCGTRCATILD